MNTQDKLKRHYNQEEFEKIIQRAAEIYHKDQEGYDDEILSSTARELDIPKKYVKQAISSLKQEKAIKANKMKAVQLALAAGLIIIICIVLIVWFTVQSSSPESVLQNMKDKYYNTLVTLDEEINTKRAQLENVIDRRFELIPKLQNLVREYAQFEKDILISLSKAQNSYQSAGSSSEKSEALAALNSTLAEFIQSAEKVDPIKSNELYQNLMFEISGSDNRIAVERKRYNDAISAYNKLVRQAPLNEYVEQLGFDNQKAYWE
ncbi:MAG: LemA family protein [Spirochaetales bacterium]|nr:LemA family protein [Spirochaetales bacterium]